jgi:cytochrome c
MTVAPLRPFAAAMIVGLAVAAGAAIAQPATQPAVPATTPATTPATAAAAQPATAPPDFAVCGACHESTAGAGPSLGPNLFGVGGRKAGSVPDYDYSDAMKAYGQPWTADNLQAFILDPAKTVPGNKMDYPGASDAAAAKAIADYLMSLKG